MFQPFLRFCNETPWGPHQTLFGMFQPFLRFYSLCVRLLWVFKFFLGFL